MKNNLAEETVMLVKQIYRKHTCGGALHIVIDDCNVDDENILWCLQNSVLYEEYKDDRALFEKCALNLLNIQTEQERLNCIFEAWNHR